MDDGASRAGGDHGGGLSAVRWSPPDGRRLLQLALATIWLLDGVLQLQPFMFTAGPKGFSGMLAGGRRGNPGFVAHSIAWNADRRPPHGGDQHWLRLDPDPARLRHRLAAHRQAGPGRVGGLVPRRLVVRRGPGRCAPRCRHARSCGGPGAVLFYALLAVVLGRADQPGATTPFVAARAVGAASGFGGLGCGVGGDGVCSP